jgi:pimeloyl-ACP methyl ester carboxylesterase
VPVHLVGHSRGGRIALNVAANLTGAVRSLDDRFRESCHKRGIHLSLQAPICVRGALRTKDWRPWQRGGERLSCRSEMRMWRG